MPQSGIAYCYRSTEFQFQSTPTPKSIASPCSTLQLHLIASPSPSPFPCPAPLSPSTLLPANPFLSRHNSKICTPSLSPLAAPSPFGPPPLLPLAKFLSALLTCSPAVSIPSPLYSPSFQLVHHLSSHNFLYHYHNHTVPPTPVPSCSAEATAPRTNLTCLTFSTAMTPSATIQWTSNTPLPHPATRGGPLPITPHTTLNADTSVPPAPSHFDQRATWQSTIAVSIRASKSISVLNAEQNSQRRVTSPSTWRDMRESGSITALIPIAMPHSFWRMVSIAISSLFTRKMILQQLPSHPTAALRSNCIDKARITIPLLILWNDQQISIPLLLACQFILSSFLFI